MSDSRDDFIIAIRYALLKKSTKQKFSLFFLIILSIATITLDRSSLSVMSTSRAVLNDLIYQVASITSVPGKSINYLAKVKKNHFSIYEQNKFLQDEVIKLKNNQFNNIFLRTEIDNLKKILTLTDTRSLEGDISIPARIILDQKSPYMQSLLTNKGTKNGILKGMSVFSKNILIGTVVEVNYMTSRILLLTDLNSKIPVIIQNSDVNAILSGGGSKNDFFLEYLPDEFNLEPDQVIFTSGKGGFLAAGIPVAQSYLNKKNEVAIKALADPDQASIIFINNGQLNK